jgi:hypothetical protein
MINDRPLDYPDGWLTQKRTKKKKTLSSKRNVFSLSLESRSLHNTAAVAYNREEANCMTFTVSLRHAVI